jgi:hypothetical protein
LPPLLDCDGLAVDEDDEPVVVVAEVTVGVVGGEDMAGRRQKGGIAQQLPS